MKKLTFFLLMLSLVWGSCSDVPVQKTDLYLYYDFTEGQDYGKDMEEDVDKYLGLLQASEESADYGTIKIYPLHDVSSGRSKVVKLKEGKGKMEGNKFLRNKEIEEFKGKLSTKLAEVNASYTGKELKRSHIFAPLCKGIKKLNKSDADRKVIVIYSDMLENSDLANFHSKSLTIEQLKASFDKACELEDVSDIEWYIVHPIDKNNDAKITKAADLWTQYLLDKGLDEDLFHFDTSIEL